MFDLKNLPRKGSNLCPSIGRFCKNESGSYAIMFALMLPVLVGLCGLGTEVGLLFFKQRDMQGAADSSAISAAVSNAGNISDLEMQAESVASSNGYINGVNGIQVTVNRPPLSGNFTSVAEAVEVIVQQPQKRLMSLLYDKGTVPVGARAVAIPYPGKGCVLALDPAVSRAAEVGGTANVNLDCGLYSNSGAIASAYAGGSGALTAYEVRATGGVEGQDHITTTQGIFENQAPTLDPYAGVDPGPTPSPCKQAKAPFPDPLPKGCYGKQKTTVNTTLNLEAGLYYFTGDLDIQSQAIVTGIGVTLVFVGDADLKIAGGATVDLRAPKDGPTAGIVIFGDRNPSTTTTFKLVGGSTQSFEGAIYVSASDLEFGGGGAAKTTCTQIVTKTVKFTGNSNLELDCEGVDINPFGTTLAELVE
jgi:Putative Flp pilus-assembly TadE/G-like